MANKQQKSEIEVRKRIGDRIKRLLKEQGRTPQELGDAISLKRQGVYLLTSGKTSMSPQRAIEIARFFNVTIGQLYGMEPLDEGITIEVYVRRSDDPEKTVREAVEKAREKLATLD
jgi:transcriptional regulator with XRE-family HTH domain